MKAKRYLELGITLVSLSVVAGCSSDSHTTTTAAPTSEQSIFALESHAGKPGGEASVTLKTLSTAGEVVTLIGEIDYDPAHLHVKDCVLNRAVAEAKPIAKALTFGEPSPGVLRAVVIGTLDPLPAGELFTCTFGVAPNAPAGAVTVHAHGDVSNAAFEDRDFATDGSVSIAN